MNQSISLESFLLCQNVDKRKLISENHRYNPIKVFQNCNYKRCFGFSNIKQKYSEPKKVVLDSVLLSTVLIAAGSWEEEKMKERLSGVKKLLQMGVGHPEVLLVASYRRGYLYWYAIHSPNAPPNRERVVRLDHQALPALSPRRGKEKSFSLLDSKGTRACLEERVKREC